MAGSSIQFFGDSEDLQKLFQLFDDNFDVIYTERASAVNQDNNQYDSASILQKFLVSHEDPVQKSVFNISEPSIDLIFREIEMTDGSGIKKVIDQNYNPDLIQILLGGEAASDTLVITTLRTTGETQYAKDLYKKFKKVITKKSARIKSFYLLPNSYEKLKQGWRLAQGISHNPMYDLKED